MSTRTVAGAVSDKQDNPPVAAMLLVGGLFLLGLQDALIKLTSSEVSLWQMQFIRASSNLVLLLVLSRFLWASAPPAPRRLWAVTLRSLFLASAMVFLFGAIPFLPLSEIAAGLYVFPLFVAALSALVLGERVGPRRAVAILIGFCGTLAILKPGTDAFHWVSLMPVAAGLCYAGTILSTRRLCREEHPVTLSFSVAVTFIVIAVVGLIVVSLVDFGDVAARWPYLLTGWHPLQGWVFGIIIACSLLNLTANISLTWAYQTAEASWLAPFDYSYLIFATMWGFILWGHVPDALSFLGAAMIAGAGTYVAWREAQLAKKGRSAK